MVVEMYSGLNLMSMMYTLTSYLLMKTLVSLNNILLPATLPLTACMPYYPTLLPYGGTPLSRISAKACEFKHLSKQIIGSGCWVSKCSVVLLMNNEVSYYDIQSVCHR